jgi:hypothetical protein
MATQYSGKFPFVDVSVRLPDSSHKAYPFQAERAFLGFARRSADVRHRFDGRKLVCWYAWHVRALTVVAGAGLGPFLTVLLALGKLKGPWYMLALAIGVNVIAWLGWIDALRNRYQIVFDTVERELKWFLHPLRGAAYALPLERVGAVEIETIHRIRGAHGNPMRALTADDLDCGVAAVACHSLVLVRDDGLRIHVVETPDRSVVEEIRVILDGSLAKNRASFRDIIGGASDKG